MVVKLSRKKKEILVAFFITIVSFSLLFWSIAQLQKSEKNIFLFSLNNEPSVRFFCVNYSNIPLAKFKLQILHGDITNLVATGEISSEMEKPLDFSGFLSFNQFGQLYQSAFNVEWQDEKSKLSISHDGVVPSLIEISINSAERSFSNNFSLDGPLLLLKKIETQQYVNLELYLSGRHTLGLSPANMFSFGFEGLDKNGLDSLTGNILFKEIKSENECELGSLPLDDQRIKLLNALFDRIFS